MATIPVDFAALNATVTEKASDLIANVLDPLLDNIKTQEDCDALLANVRAQIASLERDVSRSKLVRDELGGLRGTLPPAKAS